MSSPAGWYPKPDGRQRYWDGEIWTEHFAPGVAAAAEPPLDITGATPTGAASGTVRGLGGAEAFGLGGIAVAVLIGALGSGFSGAVIMFGLFALIVGVIALARGRVGWARLGSRTAGGAALGAAIVLITVGAIAAPPSKPAPVVAVAPTTTKPDASPTSTAATVAAPAPTTDPAATAVAHARSGTALAAAATLAVRGRAPKTGYSRAQFGQAWFDADRNGCDTRNDILRRDLHNRQMKNPCKVLAGTLAPNPYTGASIRFIYGGASEVDIDHLVALSDAWQKGAARWPAGQRLALANDPLNLLAVDASSNRSKGDGDSATWLPPNKSFRCTYVARQVAVKSKYGIWVTVSERDAMNRVLETCPTLALPGPGPAPVIAALPRTSTSKAPPPAPVPAPRQGPAPRPAPAPVQPGGGATALCNDGTLSFAAHHQGACSHHHGVNVFYK